jgi:hypothetical protein
MRRRRSSLRRSRSKRDPVWMMWPGRCGVQSGNDLSHVRGAGLRPQLSHLTGNLVWSTTATVADTWRTPNAWSRESKENSAEH